MLRTEVELASGLVRFRSTEQARSYLEAMLEHYKLRLEEYGQQMAGLLRSAPGQPGEGETVKEEREEKNGKETAKVRAKGWVKVGTLPVNVSDSAKATGEVVLKIVDEYKARTAKTAEALKSFGDLESLSISAGSVLTLFVNKGVPEALIVGAPEKAQEEFQLVAKFRAV